MMLSAMRPIVMATRLRHQYYPLGLQRQLAPNSVSPRHGLRTRLEDQLPAFAGIVLSLLSQQLRATGPAFIVFSAPLRQYFHDIGL
jgi:hypothetical protein